LCCQAARFSATSLYTTASLGVIVASLNTDAVGATLPLVMSPTAAEASPFYPGVEPHCHRRTAQKRQRQAPPFCASTEPLCHRIPTQKCQSRAPLPQEPHLEVLCRRPTGAGTIGGPLQPVPQELCHRRIPPPLLPKPQVQHSSMVLGFFFGFFILDKEYRQRDENNEDLEIVLGRAL
jgi:hypothetical protein